MWAGLENASFKKTENGYLFFPYGIFSGGYHVSEEKKAELGRFIRWFYVATLVLVIVGTLYSWWLDAILVVLLLAYYVLDVRRRLAGIPQTNERLTYSESQSATAKALPAAVIYVVVGCAILMTAGGILYSVMALRSGELSLIVGLFCIVFFGACLLVTINLMRLKRAG